MPFVIRLIDPHPDGSLAPLYLARFDLDPLPHGRIWWTSDRQAALVFPDVGDALGFWRQELGGPRPDGLPNRPLTAFSVAIDRAEVN